MGSMPVFIPVADRNRWMITVQSCLNNADPSHFPAVVVQNSIVECSVAYHGVNNRIRKYFSCLNTQGLIPYCQNPCGAVCPSKIFIREIDTCVSNADDNALTGKPAKNIS